MLQLYIDLALSRLARHAIQPIQLYSYTAIHAIQHTALYSLPQAARRFEGNELRNPQPSCDRENDFLDGNSVEHRHASRGQLATPARSGGKKRAGGRKS